MFGDKKQGISGGYNKHDPNLLLMENQSCQRLILKLWFVRLQFSSELGFMNLETIDNGDDDS